MNLPRTSRKSLASTLRHRIVIEVRTDISDGEGGYTTEWNPVVGYEAVPAAVWPIFSFQKAQYRSIDSEATHYITVRGEIAITHADHRIVFGSRIFEILSIEDIQERNIKKQITVKERVN